MERIDHDRFFKELIKTFFKEFMELFFPQAHALIDYNDATFLDKEIFTDVTEGDKHRIDILVRTKFKDEDGYVLIHIEPQAYGMNGFNRRMFKYFCRLHEEHNKKILPIAVFSHRGKKEEPTEYSVGFSFVDILHFNFLKIQLIKLNWRNYINNINPVSAALLSKMNFKKEERVKVKIEFLRIFLKLELDEAKSELVYGFFEKYLRLNKEEEKMFQEQIKEEFPQQEKEEYRRIITSWHEIGISEGRREGISEGRREGRNDEGKMLVTRQLQKKLGIIPNTIKKKIDKLGLEEIEILGESIFEINNVDDLRKRLELLKN